VPATPASIAARKLAGLDQSFDAIVAINTGTAEHVVPNIRVYDRDVQTDGEQILRHPDKTVIAIAIAQAVIEATKHENKDKLMGDPIREDTAPSPIHRTIRSRVKFIRLFRRTRNIKKPSAIIFLCCRSAGLNFSTTWCPTEHYKEIRSVQRDILRHAYCWLAPDLHLC
jgi:hypothetical protein